MTSSARTAALPFAVVPSLAANAEPAMGTAGEMAKNRMTAVGMTSTPRTITKIFFAKNSPIKLNEIVAAGPLVVDRLGIAHSLR